MRQWRPLREGARRGLRGDSPQHGRWYTALPVCGLFFFFSSRFSSFRYFRESKSVQLMQNNLKTITWSSIYRFFSIFCHFSFGTSHFQLLLLQRWHHCSLISARSGKGWSDRWTMGRNNLLHSIIHFLVSLNRVNMINIGCVKVKNRFSSQTCCFSLVNALNIG